MDTSRPGAGVALQLRVGAFVLAGLLVFAGLVYMLGRTAGLFERQYRLIASFGQIGGLIQGATVRLAGVAVGHVGEIRLPEAGGSKVRVELLIARRVQNRIRADSLARIETLGLLGDKIIDVSLGSPDAPVLPDGAELRTEEPFDTARLTQQGAELLRNLVGLSTELRTALSRIAASPAGADLAETARALRSLATEIEGGQGVLHRLVYDRKLGTALSDAGETLRQVGETVRRIDRALADPRTASLAGEAERTLVEARAAAERVNRILREVEEGKGTLHALIYDEGRVLKDLEAALARTGTLLAGVERGEGALGVLLRDPDTARAIRRVVTAADGLAQAVDRARTEDSMLRALLADPTLAGDLRDTARSFRDVTGRLARGEGVLGALTQPGGEESIKQLTDALARLGRLAEGLGDDAKLGEILTDLRQAMADLRAITGRIEGGEGTLGGLIQDPTVYENLAAFLEGAQRSVLLRALIRAAIGRGTPAAKTAPPAAGTPRP
ncbi:MAG TPA: MlaD family protein [Methylomirabilota bacterium]|jgi:phospholipid/cholesterol/gamma-HCH transport system substrate-binding protein|nr:MlaD family protein [Methylomirabilota bacterium]